MEQMELFKADATDYLFSEINKTQNSMQKQFRAVFALLTEVQKELIKVKEKSAL